MARARKLSDQSAETLLQWFYLAAKWLKIPSSWLRRVARLAPERIVVSRRQAGIPCRFAVYPRLGGELGLLIRHERQAKRLLRRYVRLGDTALDIGAHYGAYAILLGKMVGSSGAVHAFDPHPFNRQRLRENLSLNGLDWVKIQPEAISHRTGTIDFNFGNSSTVASLKALESQRDDWHQVPTTSVDAYLQRIGRPPISLVKIDVEGAEDLVLQGMNRTLEHSFPTLLLEFHVRAFSPSQALSLFDNLIELRGYDARVVFLRSRGNWREDRLPPTTSIGDSRSLLDIVSRSDNAGILFSPSRQRRSAAATTREE